MIYVIGTTNYSFINIQFCTMYDGRNFWNEVHKVSYDCFYEEATIIRDYDRAKEILKEMQNRVDEIYFSNVSILGQIIDSEQGFNKVDFVKQLKIFGLVPTLKED